MYVRSDDLFPFSETDGTRRQTAHPEPDLRHSHPGQVGVGKSLLSLGVLLRVPLVARTRFLGFCATSGTRDNLGRATSGALSCATGFGTGSGAATVSTGEAVTAVILTGFSRRPEPETYSEPGADADRRAGGNLPDSFRPARPGLVLLSSPLRRFDSCRRSDLERSK